MEAIIINLAIEDSLSESLLKKIIGFFSCSFIIGTCYIRSGKGYLKKNIRGFNNAAKGTPFLLLTDLDSAECPPLLIKEWLPYPKNKNLIFRVAVHEIESWLMAHRESFAKFLGIKKTKIPEKVDAIPDPKQFLINLARHSKYREIRDAIVPRPGSSAKYGSDYNGKLIYFVQNHWDVKEAIKYSPSLNRAFNAIKTFKPKL